MSRRRLVDDEYIRPSFYALQRARQDRKDHLMKYKMDGKVYTPAELKAHLTSEASTLDSDNWRDGEFDFDIYVAEAVLTGQIEKV